MKHKQLPTWLIWLTIPFLFILTCCNRTQPEPTLTFHENRCSYTGPKAISSEFTLTWIIDQAEHPAFIYVLVTLEPGKTVEDLAGIPAEDPPPPWVNKLNYDSAFESGTFTKSYNLSSNATFREGPIYIACFFSDENTAIGAVGPIEIGK